jgi:hypothetical protein
MSLLPSFYMVQLAFAPLPPFIASALAEIEVDNSIEGAGMFRLHFDLSRNFFGDFDAIVFDLFRPLIPIRISLSFGLGIPLTLISGFIRDVQLQVGNEPGSARLEVTGADALGTLLGQVQVPIPWPNVPDSVIATALFAKYALVPLVVPTPPTRTILDNTTVQQARDSAFLQQIAAFHSYQCFIQSGPAPAGPDFGVFMPIMAMLALPPQGVLSIDFGSQTNLNSFSLTNQMLKPTTVVSVFTESNTRAPIPVIVPAAAEMPMGMEPSLFRVPIPAIEVEMSGEAANPAEKWLQAIAKVTDSARTVSANGEVDGLKFARPLIPGLPVLIRGAGRMHSGLYLVTSVSHRISRDGYTQNFTAMRNAVGLIGAEVFIDPLAPVA